MIKEGCDFSPLKVELKEKMLNISSMIEGMVAGIDAENTCMLNEFQQIKEKFVEAESLAATFYLNCYLSDYTDKYADISTAVRHMAQRRNGALIVIEREQDISSIITPGVNLDAELTYSLLETIFIPGGPLHDGAVFIQHNKIRSAANVLPLTSMATGEKKLGTRHRAALGLSELSDALVIIVSEETGRSSFAVSGSMYSFTAE
jgi:diadenylate cyclase